MSYEFFEEIIDVGADRQDLCPFRTAAQSGAGTACQRGCMVCEEGVRCCNVGESCAAPTACLTPCPFVDYYKSCMMVDNERGETTLKDCSASPDQQGTATNFCTVFSPRNRDEMLLGVGAQAGKPMTAYQQQLALQTSLYKAQTSAPHVARLNMRADLAAARPGFWAYGPQ